MRTNLKRYASIAILIVSSSAFFAFQNCSPVKFTPKDMSSFVDKQNLPGSAVVTAGDSDNFPPLKLVFVVDNSGTMQVNQINLASAFDKMFMGDNATNLAPFESTAFIFNTAQNSVMKDHPLFSKLPVHGAENLGGYSMMELQMMRGTNLTQGKLPGDLVGYGIETSVSSGLSTVSFLPSPVVGIGSKPDGSVDASLGVTKARDGDIALFAKEFRDRVSVLDPARSEIDPATHAGILDPIVDKESGLCALARTLKRNDAFVDKGDLAALIVVSDENDSDPSGLKCVEEYADYQGTEDLVDGKCRQDMTSLTYQPPNPNATAESCSVSYRTSFDYLYKYSIPQTQVSYYNDNQRYDQPKTKVDFFTYSYTYSIPHTSVAYYTSAPTYELKRTKVNYFTELEACDMRDGIKINCTYSYPQSSVILTGDFNSNCSAFVAGKLPAGALYNKANYLPSCAATTPVAMNGACPTGNSDAQNCAMNYSPTATIVIFDAPLASQTCDQFVAGKLPAGAVYLDAGKKPVCTDSSQRGAVATGLCPATAYECVQTYTPATTTIAGQSASCTAFVNGKLGTNAVYNDAAHAPACTNILVSVTANGLCPVTPDPNKLNCVNIFSSLQKKNFDGIPNAAQTCAQYSAGKLGAYVTADSAHTPTCANIASKAAQVTGTQRYSDGAWPTYDPSVNSVCTPELEAKIRAVNGVNYYPTSCTVTNVTTGQTLLNSACTELDTALVCSSSAGAKKGCASTIIPAGNPYLEAVTVLQKGTFTCESACTDTTFCAGKSGTVGENYHACSVAAAAATTPKTFTAELASNMNTCGPTETRVVSNGPYHLFGTKPRYVAGALTEAGDPAALSKYIRTRSIELFGEMLPSVSVFVREPGDSLGTNGSLGTAYDAFADSMGGMKRSVLSDADGYASSLKDLGQIIRKKLDRSFNVQIAKGQSVVEVYYRKKGTSSWGNPIDPSSWTASGGTVTLAPDFVFEYGDQFKFDYQ
jgi:hypothetical protein